MANGTALLVLPAGPLLLRLLLLLRPLWRCGEGAGGGVWTPARPRPPAFCLLASVGPGSSDAADALACLSWLRVVSGPPRHGEGRPDAALVTAWAC